MLLQLWLKHVNGKQQVEENGQEADKLTDELQDEGPVLCLSQPRSRAEENETQGCSSRP